MPPSPGSTGWRSRWSFSTLVVLPVGLVQGFDPDPRSTCSRASAWPSSPRCCPTRWSCSPCAGSARSVFGILLSLEPAVAALAGFLFLDQRLHPLQVVGIGLVVLASVLVMGVGAARDRSVEEPGHLESA